jgi:aspartyl-tRNA(Asn)/glutamyl-tRNA(Gln) amidotransferase subunit C
MRLFILVVTESRSSQKRDRAFAGNRLSSPKHACVPTSSRSSHGTLIFRRYRWRVNMSLPRTTVENVALLARLKLNDQELEAMTRQLGQILEYVDQLSELNTDGVEPMAHAVELTNVLVADIPAASLPREQALANAPNHDDECYRVPAVLGE